MKRLFGVLSVLVIGILLLGSIHPSSKTKVTPSQASPAPSASASVSSVLGVQTKHDGCVRNGALPDPACTPGAIIPSITKEQICTAGYSSSVRNVPDSVKQEVYAEYGVVSHTTGEYEVDHLVSLELGGSNDISNLWPEPADPVPGFHQKDRLENFFHSQVCDGRMSLSEAQQAIRTNWLSYFYRMVN